MATPTAGFWPARSGRTHAATAAALSLLLGSFTFADAATARPIGVRPSTQASSSVGVESVAKSAAVASQRRVCVAGRRATKCRPSKVPGRRPKQKHSRGSSKALKRKRRAGRVGAVPASPALPPQKRLERSPGLPAVSGGGQQNQTTGEAQPEHKSVSEGLLPFRFFASTSFWNEPLDTNAVLDRNSAAIAKAFEEEVSTEQRLGQGPSINTVAYSVPIYTVPVSQAAVRVNLTSGGGALQEAWDEVPLPNDARAAAGSDKHLIVWQPSTDRLWEFWHLVRTSGVWTAGWGGAISHVSSDSGVYAPDAWPGAGSSWGASASSLSIAGGLITLEDLKAGVINHAVAVGVRNVRAGVYASPAKRTDGASMNALTLPEGARLRLNPGSIWPICTFRESPA